MNSVEKLEEKISNHNLKEEKYERSIWAKLAEKFYERNEKTSKKIFMKKLKKAAKKGKNEITYLDFAYPKGSFKDFIECSSFVNYLISHPKELLEEGIIFYCYKTESTLFDPDLYYFSVYFSPDKAALEEQQGMYNAYLKTIFQSNKHKDYILRISDFWQNINVEVEDQSRWYNLTDLPSDSLKKYPTAFDLVNHFFKIRRKKWLKIDKWQQASLVNDAIKTHLLASQIGIRK